jgi:hypothetical protein
MFGEIENEETRKLVVALLLSVSLASAAVMLFVNWFVNRFISPRTVENHFVGNVTGFATAASVDDRLERQQYTINRLENRIVELEGALRDLKVRLSEPQVPVTYQATPNSRIRYSD